MKKLLPLLFVLFFSQSAFAESEKSEKHFDKLSGKLELQEDQVEIVNNIFQEQHQKRVELRDAMKQQMQDLQNDTKSRLSSVLTADQMQTFEELHAKRMERKKERREKFKEEFKKTVLENEG